MTAGLTYFTSNRNTVVSTTAGRRMIFAKGDVFHVPKALHAAALEKGLQPCTKDGTPLDKIETHIPDEAPKVLLAPEDAEERNEKILGALKAIVERNDAASFTGGGTPNAAAVSAAVGWKVDQKEIKALWVKHRRPLTGLGDAE